MAADKVPTTPRGVGALLRPHKHIISSHFETCGPISHVWLPSTHMALSLLAVWFLIGETHRGQQWTPALTLPQVRYGLSLLLLEVCCTPGIDAICRQVQRQLLRHESARFYHHRTRKCLPQRKLHRERQ